MATTKKTETVKKTETAAAAKTAEKKETAPKKTAEKKTTAKAAPKTTAKTAAKKPTVKKTAPKKPAVKKAEAKTEVFVEYGPAQVAVDEVIKNVKATYGKDVKELKVYIKPDESKAYFVADGVEGEMDVYFC